MATEKFDEFENEKNQCLKSRENDAINWFCNRTLEMLFWINQIEK